MEILFIFALWYFVGKNVLKAFCHTEDAYVKDR